MLSLTKQCRFWFGLSLLAVLGLLEFSPDVLCGEAENVEDAQKSSKELHQISEAWFQVILEAGESRRNAKSPIELERGQTEFSANADGFIKRCLTFAESQPDNWTGLAALKLVACRSPETEQGKKAAEALAARAASANLDILEMALSFPVNVSERPLQGMTPVILDRVKKAPDHPRAAKLLATVVCGISLAGDERMKAPDQFAESADLIMKRFAESPDIVNFCEHLGRGYGSPIWAGDFEKHLRTILDRNQHRNIRVSASFALASVVQGAGESRQVESEKLYEEFLKKFDGSENYSYAPIEKMLNDYARGALVELRLRGLGKPVPEIVGVDLDGRDMKVSEFRGKVVLLSFWATWCSPCIRMVPHERELVKRLEGKQFVLVGVNGDDDEEAAKRASTKHEMTWRSFRKKDGQNGRSIPNEWNAVFPSFYLIDQAGIIRKRWIDSPPLEELSRAVDKLIDGQAENRN